MFKKLINILRKILLSPLSALNGLAVFYSKILSVIDPNGSECYWEELTQSQIDKRVNSKLRLPYRDEYKSKKFKYNEKLMFYTPTKIASFRAKTLFSKEIDTLGWIDQYGDKENIFFDIGANMGIYSLYYAKTFNGKVFAFEPSFRNLNLLTRNINLNKMEDLISVISNPIYNKESMNFFSQNYLIAGEAGGSTYGKKLLKNNYQTLSLTLDHLVDNNFIKKPNLIKIDVDGNEVDILNGALQTIKNTDCKTILVETREATTEKVKKIFEVCGFSQTIDVKSSAIWNEIWVKN